MLAAAIMSAPNLQSILNGVRPAQAQAQGAQGTPRVSMELSGTAKAGTARGASMGRLLRYANNDNPVGTRSECNAIDGMART